MFRTPCLAEAGMRRQALSMTVKPTFLGNQFCDGVCRPRCKRSNQRYTQSTF